MIAAMTRLGILGGGQLAQMTVQAAISLGIETVIFERTPDSPASRLTHHQIVGAWDDDGALRAFANLCNVITLENEFVDARVLARLEGLGLPVFPTSTTLATIQDKLRQKETLSAAGVRMPLFRGVQTEGDIMAAAADFGWPLVLKARRDGYDGYGNALLRDPDDIPAALAKLGADQGRLLMAEQFIPFDKELAVMVLRGRDGEMRLYPVVETIQQNHICHVVRAPASIPRQMAQTAAALARQAVEAVEGVGVFGVELFALADGAILFNEMAPRPHNSGHYTIEACVTSQFENHIRAALGWPLGDTTMRAPAAVMVNLLGARNGDANQDGIASALAVPGAHVHLYGKRQVRIGRKMGHITVLGDSLAAAETRAVEAAARVNL